MKKYLHCYCPTSAKRNERCTAKIARCIPRARAFAAEVSLNEDICLQCCMLLREGIPATTPDGFCSDTCMRQYDKEIGDVDIEKDVV